MQDRYGTLIAEGDRVAFSASILGAIAEGVVAHVAYDSVLSMDPRSQRTESIDIAVMVHLEAPAAMPAVRDLIRLPNPANPANTAIPAVKP